MQVLLLQPEDSPRRGPWTAKSWDLVVDLGRSSPYSAAAWSERMRCPLLRADSFRKDLGDIKRVREILAVGRGHLLDDEGIDWWTLQFPDLLTIISAILVLQRMSGEIPRSATLWSTRPGWPASALARILGLPLRSYGESFVARSVGRTRHYARLLRHLSAGQIKEIFLDKYDSAYQWRTRFVARTRAASKPVVLLPSAYTNVSRVASAYARLLPDQLFLLVATRRSATLFDPPPNVHLRGLSAYAETGSLGRELDKILQSWARLSRDLKQNPGLEMLQRLGVFDTFPAFFADGLAVRNAWRVVLAREPVCGVLCGDDSNVNTLLPVWLAARRGLPTLDFHHGAMDGYYLVKQLPCALYLAKNELERDYLLRVCGLPPNKVVVGATPAYLRPVKTSELSPKTSIVFFSEPYELAGVRTEEVYRELLPPLCKLARETDRSVVLKLHPFEVASERNGVMRAVLAPEDCRQVTIVNEPLSENLLSQAWAGVTVESTAVLDCALRGIPCFLCEWLAFSPFGYLQQFVKFGVGQVLRSVEQVADIPRQLAEPKSADGEPGLLCQAIEPRLLSQWLGAESPELVARRK
jgi:hypothetical protein